MNLRTYMMLIEAHRYVKSDAVRHVENRPVSDRENERVKIDESSWY